MNDIVIVRTRDLEEKWYNSMSTTTKTCDSLYMITYELDSIYDHIAQGIRIRSKCDWYENGEKSTEFFSNLEKKRENQNQICNLINNSRNLKKLKVSMKHFLKVSLSKM